MATPAVPAVNHANVARARSNALSLFPPRYFRHLQRPFLDFISAQALRESKPFTQTWLIETLKFSAFLNI
jgi:hypothetical protein